MVKEIPKENALSRLRREHGWSQAFLAEKVNTSQPQIDRLEKGQRRMTPEWAKRFAAVFEVHWLDLMDEEPALSRSETGLVELYRGLSEEDRNAVYRITDAMAERAGRKLNPDPAARRHQADDDMSAPGRSVQELKKR